MPLTGLQRSRMLKTSTIPPGYVTVRGVVQDELGARACAFADIEILRPLLSPSADGVVTKSNSTSTEGSFEAVLQEHTYSLLREADLSSTASLNGMLAVALALNSINELQPDAGEIRNGSH
eukprot:4378320-Pleurochrysis_carterae.AAC.1